MNEMPLMNRTQCEHCGHAAAYHTGVGMEGLYGPLLSCTFETDRYERCVCDKLELSHDHALEIVVKYDRSQR